MNNYLFLDANGSVLTAAASLVAGAYQPIVQIGSVLSSFPVSLTGSISGAVTVIGTPSISGTVNIANPLASVVSFQGGSWTTSVFGTTSVSGQVNIGSVIGAITLYSQPNSFVSGAASVNGTVATSILSAPGAGLRNYITQITFTNGGAVGTFVDIKDSGANILYSGYAAASGGGVAATFNVPIQQPTTNASIDAVPRTATSIMAAISGYKAA